ASDFQNALAGGRNHIEKWLVPALVIILNRVMGCRYGLGIRVVLHSGLRRESAGAAPCRPLYEKFPVQGNAVLRRRRQYPLVNIPEPAGVLLPAIGLLYERLQFRRGRAVVRLQDGVPDAMQIVGFAIPDPILEIIPGRSPGSGYDAAASRRRFQ